MRFSLIMPSYLKPYKNSASNLEQKILRAIDSVFNQTFEDWELLVISDGCERTMEIVSPLVYQHLPKIRLLSIQKQKIWDGSVRNVGIFKAEGEIITYIDVDDKLGKNHLQIINDNFGDADWVFFNDLKWNGKEFIENKCNMDIRGQCGTSNVAVRKSLDVYWNDSTYLHDFLYIQSLKRASSNYKVIPSGEYQVCHVPFGRNKIDI